MKRRTKRPRSAPMRAKAGPHKTSKPKRVPAKPQAQSSREKVKAHRARQRARGLRLVQMWLPDTRTAEFAAAAHRASFAVANSPTEKADQAFVDSISWLNSEEAAEQWTFDRSKRR